MKKINLLIISVVLFASCGIRSLQQTQALVNPGMSKKEVMDIMGAPTDRQFNADMEAWQYCATGIEGDHYTIVWFCNGTVTGLSTYNQNILGMCYQHFRTIRWEDAPDRTIEIRSR